MTMRLLVSLTLTLCIFVGWGVPAFAQESGEVRGIVTSRQGDPLVGATILVVNTSRGAVTDIKGRFEIRNLSSRSITLQISMIGYTTKRVETTPRNGAPNLTIALTEEAIALQAVEVTRDVLRRSQDDTRISVQNLVPREAKFLPGAGEDVMRSLQALPGVLAPNDFSSQLIIRGSGPDQNLIVMDEVEVFNPYRLYGAVSMFNPETVTEINLVSGGFPVKYGDRLSAVLDISNRVGTDQKVFAANINTSLTNANVVLEGRTPWGIPGSWLVSSRRTYYDLILGPIAKSTGLVQGDVAFPNFRDLQAKVAIQPVSDHRVTINTIFSRDGVDVVTGEGGDRPDSVAVYNTTLNTVLSANWSWAISPRTVNRMTASWYSNTGTTAFDGKLLDPVLNREELEKLPKDSVQLIARLFGLSFDNAFELSKFSVRDSWSTTFANHALEVGAGWDYISNALSFNLTMDPALRKILESNPRGSAIVEDFRITQEYQKIHVYAQDRIAWGERFFLQPGLRFDYYGNIEKAYISPRINASFALDPITTLRGAVGWYYQSPGYEKLFDQNQFFDLRDDHVRALKAEKAMHTIVGLDRWLDSEWLAKLEAYYKRFDDLVVQKRVPGTRWEATPIPGMDPFTSGGWSAPTLVGRDSLTNIPINDSYGDSYGIEVMLEKRTMRAGDRFSGWLSYSLAWAQRYRAGAVIPFNYDQRHTINIVVNYRWTSWLEMGVFWRIGSNFPFTEPIGIRPRIVVENGQPQLARDFQGRVILDLDYGGEERVNQARKPLYHRLDLRGTASTRFWGVDWAFYLDIINAYNHENISNYRYFVEHDGTLGRRSVSMFPILPTLGISARF